METKLCKSCDKDKPLSEFGQKFSKQNNKYYYVSRCRPCAAEYQREYNKSNRQKINSYALKYRLRDNFNMEVSQYQDMLDAQDGKCAICLRSFTGMNLAVDHDHSCCPGKTSCGKCVRGLLCNSCNGALGMVADNVNTLRNMIQYLGYLQDTDLMSAS